MKNCIADVATSALMLKRMSFLYCWISTSATYFILFFIF